MHEDFSDLKQFVPADCENPELFTKGKRGVIFRAIRNGIEVVIKIAHPSSKAPGTTKLEGTYLEKVNKLGIGPKLHFYDDNCVVMDFIEGTLLGDFVEQTTSCEALQLVTENILIQLAVLDEAGLNKFELTNPYKHVIVKENLDVVLIDFERMRHAPKPKNTNQFKEYIRSTIQPKAKELGC